MGKIKIILLILLFCGSIVTVDKIYQQKIKYKKNNIKKEQIAIKSKKKIKKIQTKTNIATNTPIKSEKNNLAQKKKENKIIIYTIKSGDTIGGIATKYNISLNTILLANNLNAHSLIHIGDKLTILPFSGIIYKVRKGDNISHIATKYNITADKITKSNHLANATSLKIGQTLIIPGADKKIIPKQHVKKYVKYTPKTKKIARTSSSRIRWTSGALRELYKIPHFVRGSVRNKINNYASAHHINLITKNLYQNLHI